MRILIFCFIKYIDKMSKHLSENRIAYNLTLPLKKKIKAAELPTIDAWR